MATRKILLSLKISMIAVPVLAGVASPLCAQEVGGRTTDLEQTLADVPWSNTFQLGAGVDAVTGVVAGTAVKPFSPWERTVKSTRETVAAITDEKTLKREIETAVSGKYNIFTGVDVSGKLEYLNKLDASGNTTTVVAKYISDYDYDGADNYELTDQAKSTMQSDPKAFRKAYGDYFVAGAKRGSQFTAVYHMQTAKKDDLDRFKSKIGVKADVPEVDVKGAANFNAKFEQSVGQETVQWDIDVYMDGVTGAYKMKGDKWTPAEVVKALNWFKQNEVGKPIMATLKQYSTLDASNTYPRTINIDPEVFGELSGLYAKLWEVRALFNALPENSTRKWKEAKDNFDRDVTANRKVLATDLRLRRDLTSKGSDLVSGLGKISARRVFFDAVKSTRQNEPPTGSGIGGRHQPFEYGYTPNEPYWAQVVSESSGALDIKSERRDFRVTYDFIQHGLGKRQEGLLEINDPTKLIVGWTVISNWGADHNGGWWKETNGPILLKTRGAVHVRGEETRGTNWTVIYYIVNNDDYPFQVKD
jgi:hypothetical protein